MGTILALCAALACIAASILQFAALRNDQHRKPFRDSARKITAIINLCAAGYIIDSLIVNCWAHGVFCLVVGVSAVSQIMFGLDSVFPDRHFEAPKSKQYAADH